MRILPVLDIKDGVVVRGVGGRRAEYRPIVSRLCASARPVDVAVAFQDTLSLSEFYLADLDAIAGRPPAWDVYRSLMALGCRLWVDAGVRVPGDVESLRAAGIASVVLGLETLAAPEQLAQICSQHPPSDLVFSLDLRAGTPLADPATWKTGDPLALAQYAIRCGIRRLLVLDLARVGMGAGTGTEELCRQLLHACPGLEVATGGGISGREDLRRLQELGIHNALVASALHDGRLTREDLAQLP